MPDSGRVPFISRNYCREKIPLVCVEILPSATDFGVEGNSRAT